MKQQVKMLHKKSKGGFTLIELILYVALVSIFISGAILFAWDIIYGSEKAAIQRQVNQNTRLVARRIAYEIRNASAINAVSASDLCLASADSARNPTHIYLSSEQIVMEWGGGSSDCTSMSNSETLTDTELTVDDLTFTDLSSGTDSYNIEYSFSISSTGDRIEFQKTQAYSGSAEVRSN